MSLLEYLSEIYTMSTRRFGFMHVGSANLLPVRRALELELDDYLRKAGLHLGDLQ